MSGTVWHNYFVLSTRAFGTEGHLPAEELRDKIKSHDGAEAYHCAYDLEARDDFSNYSGLMRPALGYVWFDFDSKDGGVAALADTKAFVEWLGVTDAQIYYSGSKGFHVGVPFSYFGLSPSPDLGTLLHDLAANLKKTYATLDTTIYNANRKFRALGSKHPKTKLYKIALHALDLRSSLEEIQRKAKRRGSLEVPVPVERAPIAKLQALLAPPKASVGDAASDSISLAEWRRYRQPEGVEAFKQCGFLGWARDNPASVNEPQWYACASVVGRFKDGRAQFHGLSKGHPGYSVVKTDEKLEQALQASGPRTCAAIGSIWDGCRSCPLYQKIKSPVVILEEDVIPTEATGFYDLIPKGEEIKRVPNYNDLLRRFRCDSPYRTIADMKAVYVFNGKFYEELTPIEIKAFAEEKFNPKPAEKLRQEFYHKVLANEPTRRKFFLTTTEDKINFDNGVLDLAQASATLAEHSKDFGFRGVLPYNFDTHAKCPTFDWWIADVMLGDAELVRILQEFMGYVLRGGEYKYHKALWLSGSGRNGKSTFLSVLKALIGAGNYSTLSIKQIIADKFASADLDGKIANFSEETSPEELSDSGPFKNLTGDGELLAQKKYGDPYSFRNRAKLIMTYNEVPQLKDLSPGMLSRPIIIPWKKDLTDETKQDKSLHKKLMSELPGIFNFALEGWNRLEAQGHFSHSAKSAIEMEEIRRSSCSAAEWVAEALTLVPNPKEGAEVVKPRQLYEAYKIAVGQYAYSEQKFYKRLNAIPEVSRRRSHTRTGKEYFGLKFRRSNALPTEF